MLEREISELLGYGLREGILNSDNEIYARNRLLHILHLNEWDETQAQVQGMELTEILKRLLDYAIAKHLILDTQNSRDQFDSQLMDALMPLPSEVILTFRSYYMESPQKATDYFYHLSTASNYIRLDRLRKDVKWTCDTSYGTLDITINMAKPEKDPRDIAKAKEVSDKQYPQCALCRENEGYSGDALHAPRQNHRLIPIQLRGERCYMQYSPYSYYQEHCIILNEKHVPMQINADTFLRLLGFVNLYPHYFIGSNADLPIVGGSILSHDHYQGGRYHFAMEKGEQLDSFISSQYPQVTYGRVNWPLSVIRASSEDLFALASFCEKVRSAWVNYADPALAILPYTDNTPHNTITPIARMRNGRYEMDLVLRNNRTSEQRPLGIFHPAPKWHHIKKENIGLIEVMGLAVLPARLKKELEELALCLRHNKILPSHLEAHKDWFAHLQKHYPANADWENILRKEVGEIFTHVLEDAGVFKQDETGQTGFLHFLRNLETEESHGNDTGIYTG